MKPELVDVLVLGLEVPQCLQLVLERVQADPVLFIGASRAVLRILEVREDEGLVGGLELANGGLEFLFGKAAHLGVEQHHEDVAAANLLVVFVLQARVRQRVEKVFPHDEVEINALIDPLLVLATDQDFEVLAVFLQFGGGGQEYFVLHHRVAPCGRLRIVRPAQVARTRLDGADPAACLQVSGPVPTLQALVSHASGRASSVCRQSHLYDGLQPQVIARKQTRAA